MQLRVHIKEHDAETFISLPRNLVLPLLDSKTVGLEPIVIPLKITWNEGQSSRPSIFSSHGDFNNKDNRNNGQRVAYVAWSGSSSSQYKTIEIGSPLAEVFQLKEDQIVYVEPVAPKDCQKATRVYLQTLSDTDWSLVALHRDYLEQVLLNQVRVVAQGQPVPVRLSGNTQVVLFVKDVQPKSACNLLEYDSILQVEPPPSTLENRVSSSTTTTTQREDRTQSKRRVLVLRLNYSYEEPYCYGFRVHPKTAAKLQLSQGDFMQVVEADAHITACITLDDSVPLSHVMLHFYQALVAGFHNGSRVFAFPVKEENVNKTRTPKSVILYTLQGRKEQEEMNEEETRRQWLQGALMNIHSERIFFCSNRIILSNPQDASQVCILCFDDYRIGERVLSSTYDEPWYPTTNEREASSRSSSKSPSPDSKSGSSLLIYHLNIHSCKEIVIHRSPLPSKFLSTIEETKSLAKDAMDLDQKSVIGEAPNQVLQSLYDTLSPVFSFYDPFVLQEQHSLDSVAPPWSVKPACCHFFYCSSGYGSSFLVAKLERKLAQRLPNPVQVLSLHLEKHAGEPWSQTCNRIREIFTLAYRCRPSLIVLMDSQEMFCHSAEEKDWARESLEALVMEYIEACFYQGGIAVLFVSKKPLVEYPTKFIQSGLFAEVFTLDSLILEDKIAILKEMLKDMPTEPHVWNILQGALDGCSIKDLERLVGRINLFTDATHNTITEKVVTKALDGFQPVAFMGQSFGTYEEDSEVKDFSHIGGLHQAKELVRDILELPLKYPKLFASAPIRLASGALIYGPPGCGKTLLVRASAKQFHLRIITVKGPELLNKYIGASEAAVRSCFQRAASLAPCILFFDELESLAPQRGSDSTGVSDRVVNALLAELDGVEPLQKGVFVIAATSRPDLVDAALLRPGRLDKWIALDIPTMEERKEILSILLEHAVQVDLEYFARATQGYTGADLRSIVSNAYLKRFKRNKNQRIEESVDGDVFQSGLEQDLKEALEESVASLSVQEREKYRRIGEKMRRNEGNALEGSHKARVALV